MTTKDKSPKWRGKSPEKAAREPPPKSDGHQPHDQRICRMRREIRKSHPTHAEMKSKKACSKSSLLRPSLATTLPLHQGLQSSGCVWFYATGQTLLDTARDLSKKGECWSRGGSAASVQNWRQRSWSMARLGSSTGLAGRGRCLRDG